MRKKFLANRIIIVYGIALAALIFLLKWLELRFLIFNHAFEVYIGSIALLFLGLGIWIAVKVMRPKTQTVIVEKEVYVSRPESIEAPDDETLSRIGLSKREWEVLTLMSEGLSNQEIADRLFVSLNTIKTHSSNIFEKLDVKRRTQAIEKGKKLGILA